MHLIDNILFQYIKIFKDIIFTALLQAPNLVQFLFSCYAKNRS